MELVKYCIFCTSIIKPPKSVEQYNEVIIIIEEKMTVMRDPKTFCFNFEWPKCVEENLKYLIEFIIKMNESLVENKIKNKKTMKNYC